MGISFRELKIWQKAYELLKKIYKITAKYPVEEKFNLVSQTRSSGNSVLSQIAEAHGRYYFADKIRVLFIARGECFETMSHLSVAYGLGYITDKKFTELDKEYEGLAVGINSYIDKISNTHKKKS